jgi:DNA replication protein DnaC
MADTPITNNLPFKEWTGIFGTERLTGVLFARSTHHVNILEMNGEIYRLNHSRNQHKNQT